MGDVILNSTQQRALSCAREKFDPSDELTVRVATRNEIDQAISQGVRDVHDLEQLVDRFVVENGSGRRVFVRLTADAIVGRDVNGNNPTPATNWKAFVWTLPVGGVAVIGRAFQGLRGVFHLGGALITAAGMRSKDIAPEHRARAAAQAAGAGLKHIGQATVGLLIDGVTISSFIAGNPAPLLLYIPELTARVVISSKELKDNEIANLGPQVVVLSE